MFKTVKRLPRYARRVGGPYMYHNRIVQEYRHKGRRFLAYRYPGQLGPYQAIEEYIQ